MKNLPLPTAWKKIPSSGEIEPGTPEDEWKTTSESARILPKIELACWTRGGRYVRICKVLKSKKGNTPEFPFRVLNGFLDSNKEHHIVDCQGEEDAVKKALFVMQRGGY